MLVRSDRRFTFAVGPDALWSAIADVDGYRHWWPWLRRFDAGGLEEGAAWRCTVQPPLPYVLRFTVAIEEVRPLHRVSATVDGDIHGTAALEIDGTEGSSEVRLTSALAPRSRGLQLVAAAAGPVVRFGHDWVLDTGARQFTDRALPRL